MNIGTYVITVLEEDHQGATVHFVAAYQGTTARSLAARRLRVSEDSLSVVLLHRDEGPPTPSLWFGQMDRIERYLGPLDAFSPHAKQECRPCRGTGRIIGESPSPRCPTCGGSGYHALRAPETVSR